MRSLRALVAVFALLLLVAGTALATRSSLDRHGGPQAASNQASPSEAAKSNGPKSPDENTDESESGAQLTDAHAAELVDLLNAAGITATAAELKTLAAKYGVGGAVRLEAWADATGKSVAELGAMFDGGMGWGAIAHQLEQADSSLHLSPGVGSIMGHGHGHANGQANAAKHAQGNASPSS